MTLYSIVLTMALTLTFLLRWEDDGHHAKLFCGPVVLDIDRSGFPGGDTDFRLMTTNSGLHIGHGQFSVSLRGVSKHEKLQKK